MNPCCIILSILLCCSCLVRAQEETATTLRQGRNYIELNLSSLEKYNKRIQKEQTRLLRKLSRKETRLLRQLKKEDSTQYQLLQDNPLTYDSIRTLLKADSSTRLARTKNKADHTIDSLKKIQQFLQGKTTILDAAGSQTTALTGNKDYTREFNTLNTDLSYQDYLNRLIDQKTQSLKGIGGNNKNLTGIQKEVFYAKAKMKTWKQIADDPDKTEEKALEWLQGTEGFDKAFTQQQRANDMHSATSAEDLEKMGYQTKRQLNKQLQEKFGNNLGTVQDNMGKQVGDWQQQAQGITGKAQQAGEQLRNTSNQLKEARQTATNLKNTQKPAFRINPMRGLPFRERIEKSYTYQARRATADGRQPAILEFAGTAGYKHTPKLTTGIGIAANIGLGQNWNNIRLSMQGIGARAYAQWEGQYGIAAYAGYERMYKQIGNWQMDKQADALTGIRPTPHNNRTYSEAVLIGLSKRYRMNNQWNGAVQVLYDIWWKDKGLRSPVVLRFVTSKK